MQHLMNLLHHLKQAVSRLNRSPLREPSERQVNLMDKTYQGMAIGIFELDSYLECFVALDAAAKADHAEADAVQLATLGNTGL